MYPPYHGHASIAKGADGRYYLVGNRGDDDPSIRFWVSSDLAVVGDALVDAGFTLIEVPLNSPEPLESVALLAKRLGSRAVVGAGTVLHPLK